jgi:hypothetical protein
MSAYRESSNQAWTEDSVRVIATPSSFAKSTLYYVQEAGHFHTLEPYYTEREQLDSYLMVYTIAGKGKLTYQEKTYTLFPNQLFFIDCMEYQHYATDKIELWELIWVHLNGSSVRGYYEQFAVNGNPVITLTPESKASSILRQLIQTQRHKSFRTELVCSQYLVELLTELLLAASSWKCRFLRCLPILAICCRSSIRKRTKKSHWISLLSNTPSANIIWLRNSSVTPDFRPANMSLTPASPTPRSCSNTPHFP